MSNTKWSYVLIFTLPLGLLAASCGGQQSQAQPPQTPEGRLVPASGTAVERTAPPGAEQPTTEEPAPQPTTSEAAPEATPEATPLTDSQIDAALDAINTSQIDLAETARKKAKHRDVKRFAALMIKDYEKAQKNAEETVKKLGLTPADSPLVTGMRSDAQTAVQNLAQMKGADFDMAFMDNQVRVLEKALDTLDNTLMKQVTAPELKNTLSNLRDVVQRHLEEAKKIRETLERKK